METAVIDDKYVEEELKREAEAFASGSGRNTGFCLRGLCGQDVSKIDMSNLSEEMFKKLTFDSKTIFSPEQEEKFHPSDIIEQGKQFGNIGESEIDGSGTTIAIIDRFSDISAEQFQGRTITVYRVSKDGVDKNPVQPNKEGIYLEGASVEENGLENGFHGNTIDSLAVGEKCGVAPKANVVLFHVDGIKNQEAQEHVIEFIENREEEFAIPDIISISAKTKIDEETLKELEKLGCAFINSDIFMKDFTWGRSNDDGNELLRDEFIQYTIDAFADRGIDINKLFNENKLIPVTGRTSSYIDDKGKEVFKYNGSFCGNSFAICQVAGMFLLARQIDPPIKYDEFIDIVKNSERVNSEGMMYVDPVEIVKELEEKNKIEKEPELSTENYHSKISYFNDQKSDLYFTEQKIGKATVNTPTKNKDRAYDKVLNKVHERTHPEEIHEHTTGTQSEI